MLVIIRPIYTLNERQGRLNLRHGHLNFVRVDTTHEDSTCVDQLISYDVPDDSADDQQSLTQGAAKTTIRVSNVHIAKLDDKGAADAGDLMAAITASSCK